MSDGSDEPKGAKPVKIHAPAELRSGALVLRPWSAADVPAFQHAVHENLDHLRPWMPWADQEHPIEERAALVERWAELIEAATDWQCGIWVDGEVAGSAGLMQRREPGTLEIGYWVDRGHTRRGIATLTSYLLTTLAFESPETEAVEIWHDRANLASRAVPRKLGYELVREQVQEADVSSPGEEGIECIWRLTRQAWGDPARRPQEPQLR
jgi:ribosomal-protein-serine acetyltransferase